MALAALVRSIQFEDECFAGHASEPELPNDVALPAIGDANLRFARKRLCSLIDGPDYPFRHRQTARRGVYTPSVGELPTLSDL